MNRHLAAAALTASACLATASAAGMKDVPHPFIMWTKEEAAALKQRIDRPQARSQP